jgi:tripartite-type tricarboxylate transporter receptor subunit TctC
MPFAPLEVDTSDLHAGVAGNPMRFFQVVLIGVLILLLGLVPTTVSAAWPEKSISLLIGFKAGGATDLLGRLVGKGLEKELGVPVVVINKGGAGGALAYDEVHRAAPDGYTLGWVTGSLFTTTNIGHLKWGYEELDPVARIAQWPLVVGVRSDAPWKSWQDFLIDAKSNPNKYKFGHAGTGSIGHLMNVALSSQVDVVFVPIGVDQRFSALLGGQIDLLSAPAAGFVTFSQANKMRALVVSSEKRVPLLPDTPTAKEVGTDFQVDLMYGVFAPPNTPKEVKDRLRTALKNVTSYYEPLQKFVETKQMNLEYLDGPALDQWLMEQNATVTRIMKEVGLFQSRVTE